MYKVVLLPAAEKFYKKLLKSNRTLLGRIDHVLELLKTNPFIGKALKDNLKDKYSLRIGVYRIVYSVHKKEVTVYIFDIGHRREVYR